MQVKLIEEIKKDTGLTNYALAKKLKEIGVSLSIQAINHYEHETPKSMRFDVLCGLKAVSGYSWAKIGALLTDEINRAGVVISKKISR